MEDILVVRRIASDRRSTHIDGVNRYLPDWVLTIFLWVSPLWSRYD